MWPELGERHGWVEAGEDGDGVEFSGVPHELGLVVHSDNLAGVNLDKTAMNKWKASTIYYGFPFNIMLRKYKSNDQTSPELTSTSTNFQSKPESNSDKAASDTTWFLLPALIVNIQAPTWLGLASSGDQQQAKEKRNQFGHCYVLCGVGIVLWVKKLRLCPLGSLWTVTQRGMRITDHSNKIRG